MFEKLEELAKNNKKISDFYIRSGWPLAYRQTGEIHKVKEVMVKAQDLMDLIASNCNEVETKRFQETHELDSSVTLSGLRFRANFYKTITGPAAVLRRVETVMPEMAQFDLPQVLYDIIDMHKGLVLVTGPTGSGKSTTARVITGLLPQLKGEIIFDGKKLSPKLEQRSKEELRRIQIIFQMPDTAMNPRQTVDEIIGRPIEFYQGIKGKEREAKVIELLKMIELDETFLDRLPSELSGGQKQRICIARALAANPDLIICDEVTSALDQIVQEGILKLLQKLQKELGVTYIFITHDIATVKAISDEIVVMYQGEVVEQGLKSKILNPPYPDYTELLLSSVPEMDPDWLTNLLNKRSS